MLDAATADPEALEGKTVLYRDRNGWDPYAERLWLALELKRADYVTCLVDDDYSCSAPPDTSSLRASQQRVIQWPDGTTSDGASIADILQRIQTEHPHAPDLFPKVSVSVNYVTDSFERFDGVMPRFTKPNPLG